LFLLRSLVLGASFPRAPYQIFFERSREVFGTGQAGMVSFSGRLGPFGTGMILPSATVYSSQIWRNSLAPTGLGQFRHLLAVNPCGHLPKSS